MRGGPPEPHDHAAPAPARNRTAADPAVRPRAAGRGRRLGFAGPVLLLLVLLPAAALAYRTAFGDLGTDPVETLERETGIWALRLLGVTLLVTPLRRLLGWNWLAKHRRTLGVATFAYATLHLLIYLAVDQGLALGYIVEDVVEHPWVLLGMVTWLMLLPLAVTSTAGWVRRLGGRRWASLHRLTYLCAITGTAHYFLAVKRDVSLPLVYASIFAALLGYRLWLRARRTGTARPTG